ncbi:hypothetical protein AK812_SmicGene33180 [Symbiodinium microadriaticum]|uniref:Uncharacterized protein n=1 Tax=Symbiodinium microadriaticum TaxID=2951 RepID=A0A1Q9CSB4_SYMMI|nr:hypothetical protein AK812_SmicGene33180 [Symbiodinium microadriaticum]
MREQNCQAYQSAFFPLWHPAHCVEVYLQVLPAQTHLPSGNEADYVHNPLQVMVKILANGDIVPDNDPRAQASVTQRRPPTAKASATPPPNPPSTASGAGAGAGGGGFAGDVGDGENVIVGDLARACGIYGRTVQVMDREVPMIYLIVAGVLALLWISGNTNAIRMGVFAFMLYVMYTQYTKENFMATFEAAEGIFA